MATTSKGILLFFTLIIAHSARSQPVLANPISATNVHLEQYVTRVAIDTVWVKNTGREPIRVDSITTNSADERGGYISFSTVRNPPFTIPPHDSIPVSIRFSPGETPGLGIPTGRRNYSMELVIENSAGTPITSHVSGRAYMVDMHSFIPRDVLAQAGTWIAPIPIIIDKWIDTLGKADVRGFILEVIHYRRTVLWKPDSAYNMTEAGSIGTNSHGAVFTENVFETWMNDQRHNVGQQGYYEMNVGFAPQNVGRIGTLMNLRLFTLAHDWTDSVSGELHLPQWVSAAYHIPFEVVPYSMHWLEDPVDTSNINYYFKNPIDQSNDLIQYINITQDPGLVSVGAVPKDWNLQSWPNPVVTDAMVRYSIPWPSSIKIELVDILGRVISTPLVENVNLGTYEIPLHLRSLIPGVYFVQLRTADHREVMPFVKVAQ